MNLIARHPDEEGVSPVVAVILVVAITVILASVIGIMVLDIGRTATDGSQQNLGVRVTETTEGTVVQVVTGTADELRILVNGADPETIPNPRPGDEAIVYPSAGDRVTVLAHSNGDTQLVSEVTATTSSSSPVDGESPTQNPSTGAEVAVHNDWSSLTKASTLSHGFVRNTTDGSELVFLGTAEWTFDDGTREGWIPLQSSVTGASGSEVDEGSHALRLSSDGSTSTGTTGVAVSPYYFGSGLSYTVAAYDGSSGDKHHEMFFGFGASDPGDTYGIQYTEDASVSSLEYAFEYGNLGGANNPTLNFLNNTSVLKTSSNQPEQGTWYEVFVEQSGETASFTSTNPDGTTRDTLSAPIEAGETGRISLSGKTGNKQTGSMYVDSVSVDTSGGDGVYVSTPYTDGTTADGAFVDMRLDGATATIVWEQYNAGSDSWTELTRETVSTTGRHQSAFGTSVSDDVRVRITVTGESTSPTAVLNEEGLYTDE